MQRISNVKIINVLLIMCLVQASHAGSLSSSNTVETDLKCYVCEDCAKITKATPLLECDEDYFDDDDHKTISPEYVTYTSTTNAPYTTTTIETTTTITTDNTNSESSTSETTTSGSTTEAVPTAPTVGPLNTTTAVTPLNMGTVPTMVAEMGNTNTTIADSTDSTSTVTPNAMPMISEDYTYHCYSVQRNVNGTMSVDRGCARVTTMQSVCGLLEAAVNNGVKLSKCTPCSNSECNGSSALDVSMAALLFTLVAALLSRK